MSSPRAAPPGDRALDPRQRRARGRARHRSAGRRREPAVAAAWAPAATAAIHPGVQMYTEGAQCTANFVFTDGAGNVYVGYAAHCAGTGAATDTNGCDAGSLPLGTRVDFTDGGSLVSEGTRVGGGTLAYSSWLTMQQRGETRREHLRLQRLRAGQGRRRRRRQGQPVASRSGAARSASTPTAPPPATRSTPTATPACAAASPQLSPKQGVSLGTDGRRAGATRSTP